MEPGLGTTEADGVLIETVAESEFEKPEKKPSSKPLADKKIAVLVADGFEQSELEKPVIALKGAGADVNIISLKSGKIIGWKNNNWGDELYADKSLDEVKSEDFDALVLPGGVLNPDQLRAIPAVIKFVSDFFDQDKPIAAICHGPWILIETGKLQGRRITSYASLRTDLENAGAKWVDEPVVIDHKLLTSRGPDDLPVFCKALIEEIAEGQHV